MNSRQKIYWKYIESEIPRFIAQLDRNPFSPTYGSFDRKYWHQRFTDFSSAALQQGVETLAHLYGNPNAGERFIGQNELVEWIEAGVLFTSKIQNWDGTFDEWYVGERGWAGPTAYVLNSLFTAYEKTGEQWRPDTRSAYMKMLIRAARALMRYEEFHTLSNHQALAMLAVYQAYRVTNRTEFYDGYSRIKIHFLEKFNNHEGWSLEYDGADPGYQSATLSFLARLHELNPEHEWVDLAERQIQFLKPFFYSDGTFARGIGSRSTSALFFFSLEYWAKFVEGAQSLTGRALESLDNGKILRPGDQEDHYLIYRLPEIFKAWSVAQEVTIANLNLTPEIGTIRSSQFLIKSANSYQVVMNHRFGGRHWIFDQKSGACLGGEGDVTMRLPSGEVFSSGCGKGVIDQTCTDAVIVSTPFLKLKFKRFNPFSFLIFKLTFLLLSWHPKLAQFLKMWIRKKLMYSTQSKKIHLKRTFEFLPTSIRVRCEILGVPKQAQIRVLGDDACRYVPQSQYFIKASGASHSSPSQMVWVSEYQCVP